MSLGLKLTKDAYNRKKQFLELPSEFDTNLSGSSGALDFKTFFKTYRDAWEYRYFLMNMRMTPLMQLLADHRKNRYCMYKMIDSGKVDDYGCLIASAMKELRPKKINI